MEYDWELRKCYYYVIQIKEPEIKFEILRIPGYLQLLPQPLLYLFKAKTMSISSIPILGQEAVLSSMLLS